MKEIKIGDEFYANGKVWRVTEVSYDDFEWPPKVLAIAASSYVPCSFPQEVFWQGQPPKQKTLDEFYDPKL